MTFDGQYITYNQYIEWSGSQIDETSFNLLEFEARRLIDVNTYGRLKNTEQIPQEVVVCDYKLVKSLEDSSKMYEQIDQNGNVANEMTDGYSIGYITADRIGEVVKSKKSELNDIIRTYLLTVIVDKQHIMYCGVE